MKDHLHIWEFKQLFLEGGNISENNGVLASESFSTAFPSTLPCL